MEERINGASLSFKCEEKWEAMKAEGDGRFCGVCQKKVYDLTDKKAAYFLQIMQENNNNVCGRFTVDQLVPAAQSQRSVWKRWAVAAMVFIGFGATGQKANAQEELMGKVVKKETKPDLGKMVVLGFVAPRVVEDAELNSLHEYLVMNCKVPESTNGRLIASFSVKKDGSFSQIRLTEQLPKPVREEVLRAIKASPKWQQQGHVSAQTLHLTFKHGKIVPYGNKKSSS
ncbi:hypothetical protein SAMN05421820_103220 [Pedobacter steynii]|uniref:TonB C-terminal domain-containing protein n=1 Tax=Pedobacter steynii TaxID=430522 RepID=A0A1G9REL2_9SPHI|nr:hypothetical protein [Pedobacter steynii]NQX37780.1 hypothetical protein [Pedobacter steynii]SDM21674.1 hypothetical protein SAMN05421820_103220 [Pedobacter steynii]